MGNRMPQPAVVVFAAHKTPHLLNLRRFHAAHFDRNRLGTPALPTLVLTTERPDAFFELREYRVRTDVPTPGAIPYPPPLERPLAQLPLHRGQPPRICIGLQERPPTALTLLPAQPPLPITGLARLSHGLSLTMRTPHACFRPRLPSSLMPS